MSQEYEIFKRDKLNFKIHLNDYSNIVTAYKTNPENNDKILSDLIKVLRAMKKGSGFEGYFREDGLLTQENFDLIVDNYTDISIASVGK